MSTVASAQNTNVESAVSVSVQNLCIYCVDSGWLLLELMNMFKTVKYVCGLIIFAKRQSEGWWLEIP